MADRAVLYLRESRDESLKSYSPDIQRGECRAYCAQQGYTVVEEVLESGTGHNMDGRPDLLRLRKMMRRAEFDVLVVWRFDRLHRNQMNQAVVLYEGKQAGVRVESATESNDDSPIGQLVKTIIAFKAEQEWHDTRLRTQKGLQARVDNGFPLVGCKAPYGYAWGYSTVHGKRRKTHLTIDESTSAVVRLIFEMLYEGNTLAHVAGHLNQQGIRTPKGAETWLKNTVRQVAINPVYRGELYTKRTRRVETRVVDESTGEYKTKVRQVPNETPVALPSGIAPAIVDYAVANTVLAILAQRKSVPMQGKTLNPEHYLLRGGYVVCGICGASLSCRRRSGRTEFYVCHRGWDPNNRHSLTIPVQEIDPIALSWVTELLGHSEVVKAALEDVESRREESTGHMLQTLRGMLNEAVAEQDGLVDSMKYVRDERARARIGKEMDDTTLRITDLEKRIHDTEHADMEWETLRSVIQRVREYTPVGIRRVLFDFGIVFTVHRPDAPSRITVESRLLKRMGLRVKTVSFFKGFMPVLTTFVLRRSLTEPWSWGFDVTQHASYALY